MLGGRARVVVAASLVATTVWSTADAAGAQQIVEESRDRPGLMGLLVGSLMLLTWAAAFAVVLHRSRSRRGRDSTITGEGRVPLDGHQSDAYVGPDQPDPS